MMVQRGLLSLLLSLVLASSAWAQGVTPTHPVKPNGAALFPAPFAGADNVANQTATAMHGLMFVWDGSAWDRWTGAVTGSGNFTVVQGTGTNLHIVCDSGCGGASTFADNAAFTFGTTPINISGFVFDDTAPNAATENSAAAPRMSGNRVPYSILRDAAGNERGANVNASNELQVAATGTVTANAGTNLNTSSLLTTAQHDAAFGTAGTADAQVRTIQGIASMTPVVVSATNLDVQIGGSDSLVIGTFPDNEPFNLAQIAGTAPAAHDALMSTDSVPLTAGCFSETPEDSDANTNANRTSADADKGRLTCTRNGEVFVREGGVHKWTYHENSSSALTDTTIHAACGASLFNYITAITFSIGGATAASVLVEDSTTTAILGPYYLEAINGRGLHVTFPGGKKQTTANTLIAVTTTGAVAHGLDIQGFCAP